MHNNAILGLLTPTLAVFFASLSDALPDTWAAPIPRVAAASTPSFQASEDASIQRALELRDGSGRDWNAGRFADAAEKLEEALSIYVAANTATGDDGGYVDERAITLRALVWNEFRAGAEGSALVHFEELVDLADSYSAAAGQLPSVYSAITQQAETKKSLSTGIAFWKSVQDVYDAYGNKERLAQILIDRARMYSRFGEIDKERRDLNAAITAHRAIDDFDGANWSRNNLGYTYIESKEWNKAIGPISEALAEIRAGRGLAAQSALGYNLLEVSTGAVADERPDRKLVDSLWSVAEEEARAEKPAIVAPERLLVSAMGADVARVGAKRAKGAADRLLRAMPGASAALRADLTLHAAALLLDGGARREAQDLVGGLNITEGPVAAHLAVRQAVLSARVAAALEDERDFERSVSEATDAVAALDHDSTTRGTYEQLAEAAKAFPKSSEARAVQASWQKLQQQGRAGGAGGSSMGGATQPDMAGAHELGSQAPLFALSTRDGRLVAKDLLTGEEATRPLDWDVRTVDFNGMKMELFGGYVAVVDMNYGNRSVVKGSPSGLSLDDLENFRPLDEGAVLFVTKTGATFYGQESK